MASRYKKDALLIVSSYASESMEEMFEALKSLYVAQGKSFKKYSDCFELKLLPLMKVEKIKEYVKKSELGKWKCMIKKCIEKCINVLQELSCESEEMVEIAEKMEDLDIKYESTIEKMKKVNESIKKVEPNEKKFLEEVFSKLKDQHDALGVLVKMGRDIMQCAGEEIKALEQVGKDADELSDEAPILKRKEKTRKRLTKLIKIFGFLLLREKAEIGVLTDTEKEEIQGMEARSIAEIRRDMKKIVTDVNLILKEEYPN